MARIIKMPPKGELPEGPRREFVEELRRYYRAAGRPPLRRVSALIEGRADLKEVTASQETVRRILRGIVIPTDWNRVNAVFQVFCEIGGIGPDADRWEDSYNGEESNREYVRRVVGCGLGRGAESAADPAAHPAPSRADPGRIGIRQRPMDARLARVLARATNRRSSLRRTVLANAGTGTFPATTENARLSAVT